jgi:hypothetical protein
MILKVLRITLAATITTETDIHHALNAAIGAAVDPRTNSCLTTGP